jgi:hypothetical protein
LNFPSQLLAARGQEVDTNSAVFASDVVTFMSHDFGRDQAT